MKDQPSSLTQLQMLADYDPNSLPVEQAREYIRQFLIPVAESASVGLHAALGRTLSDDVLSPINVPPHDNSAMDGYAVHSDPSSDNLQFKMIGSAHAGHPFDGRLAPGECVRIMTGAPIPAGCDSVVMQEHVEADGDRIKLTRELRSGQNIRRTGEDIEQGSAVVRRGQLIGPAEMGLLASLGLNEIPVYRKLRVALFSTGDELQQPGQPLAQGHIYDSNRYSLLGLLQDIGAEIQDRGSVADDPASLKAALQDAAAHADVIITSGGVSVGEADYIKQLLAEIGEVVFWKIAMKPGRPLAYGKIGQCHFFGLPGNPVAVMVTFLQFVRDALLLLMGQTPQPAFVFRATCTTPIRKLPGRTEFQRGILSQDAAGELTVRTTGEQGSGILSSMSKANCFIILPTNQGSVEAGTTVQVQLF